MYDTYVTIVGNVLTAPEWRRTAQSGTLVANFKVASTARRLDRESGRWVDGNSLRVRVNCWRRLAEGVAASVMVGDPVIVVGRMYTRDWVDDAGNHRTLYELEAVAVGHDLSRGRGRFLRNRPTMTTSTLEDAEAEARVRGEIAEPVSDRETADRETSDGETSGREESDREESGPPEDVSFLDEVDLADLPVSPAPGYHPVDLPRAGLGSGVGLVAVEIRDPAGTGSGTAAGTDQLTECRSSRSRAEPRRRQLAVLCRRQPRHR